MVPSFQRIIAGSVSQVYLLTSPFECGHTTIFCRVKFVRRNRNCFDAVENLNFGTFFGNYADDNICMASMQLGWKFNDNEIKGWLEEGR